MFSRKLTRFIAIGATAVVLAGGSYGIVSATASTGSGTTTTTPSISAPSSVSAPSSASAASAHRFPRSGGSNARSGPAAGGSSGKVEGVTKASFTITTPAGQKVTVKKTSSTKYEQGTSSTSASAVKKGAQVLVLGRTNGTTITASKIIIQPAAKTPARPSAAEVVPFQRGSQTTSKQTGQIPTSYSQGSGTILTGTPANRATEAALGAYPGGVIDRVVKLSNGEYEAHNIGVNWPHHIFLNQDFKVIGAD